jgi:hypothetical protein
MILPIQRLYKDITPYVGTFINYFFETIRCYTLYVDAFTNYFLMPLVVTVQDGADTKRGEDSFQRFTFLYII